MIISIINCNVKPRAIRFNIKKCRTRKIATDLYDCLSPKQAGVCGHSISFGYGFFCKHLLRIQFAHERGDSNEPKQSETNATS